MKAIVIKTPKNYDSDDLHFIADKGESEIIERLRGFAYIGKADKKIGLIKCPLCSAENYLPAVTTGICVWCGFDANKVEIKT